MNSDTSTTRSKQVGTVHSTKLDQTVQRCVQYIFKFTPVYGEISKVYRLGYIDVEIWKLEFAMNAQTSHKTEFQHKCA